MSMAGRLMGRMGRIAVKGTAKGAGYAARGTAKGASYMADPSKKLAKRMGQGAVKGTGQGASYMAGAGKRLANDTAAGKYLKAHPKLTVAGGLMGAGAVSSRRRGRGTDRTRGIPRGIYRN